MRRLLHVAMTRARTAARARLRRARPSAGAAQPPSPFAEEARAALGAEWEEREEELFGPAETLHATYRTLRDELLESDRSGPAGASGELRFDTDLDVSHAVVRYLEVVKLAALIERAPTTPAAESPRRCPRSTRLLQARHPSSARSSRRSALDD